jgi:hypothetical protein
MPHEQPYPTACSHKNRAPEDVYFAADHSEDERIALPLQPLPERNQVIRRHSQWGEL